MEAVVKQARTTRHLWLVACNANVDLETITRKVCGSKNSACSLKRQEKEMTPCRSTGPKGELIGRASGDATASRSLQGKKRVWKWWKTWNQDILRRLLSWWKETRRFRKCVS